jgi:uncharacterized membrane protein YdfJ with MMPL/SSD domain
MLKFLEITWLCIAILTFAIASWQFFTEDFSSAIFMLIGTAIAIAMFIIRRKQRKRFDRYKQEQKKAG